VCVQEKKEHEAKEREARIEAAEPLEGETAKEREYEQLLEVLTPLKLKVNPIRPDGHCMFRAVSTQCTLLR
jgi:hypothetical protein